MRKENSHKGDNGKVLVIAGSKDYPGAAFLTAYAVCSLRLGADLVTVATPENVAWSINSISPDVITVKLKGDYITEKHEKILNKLIKNNDVILIGPGISKNKKTLMFIRRLIEKCKKPKVIDADALKAINLKNIKNYIITPHHNEYGTILNNSNLREHELAKYIDRDIILLKGKVDRIISKEKTYLNRNGNSGMTVGGTGDILAGLCAGYLSQGYSKLESAKKAAYLNGKIGDKLKKRYGYGFIASDFLKEIAIENKKIKK